MYITLRIHITVLISLKLLQDKRTGSIFGSFFYGFYNHYISENNVKYAGISQSNSSEFYLQNFCPTVLVKNYIIFKIVSKIITKLILLYKCSYTCAPSKLSNSDRHL